MKIKKKSDLFSQVSNPLFWGETMEGREGNGYKLVSNPLFWGEIMEGGEGNRYKL